MSTESPLLTELRQRAAEGLLALAEMIQAEPEAEPAEVDHEACLQTNLRLSQDLTRAEERIVELLDAERRVVSWRETLREMLDTIDNTPFTLFGNMEVRQRVRYLLRRALR